MCWNLGESRFGRGGKERGVACRPRPLDKAERVDGPASGRGKTSGAKTGEVILLQPYIHTLAALLGGSFSVCLGHDLEGVRFLKRKKKKAPPNNLARRPAPHGILTCWALGRAE